MSKDNIIVGLDVGSTKICTIVVERDAQDRLNIIGVGESKSNGIRKGVVVNVEETVSAISESLERAERMAGVPIEHAYIGIGGAHISAQNSRGVIAVSRADQEISQADVDRVIEGAKAVSIPVNREIIHVIPTDFIVDGQGGIKDPRGINGVRLEVEAHIIEGSTAFIKNLSKCVEQAGLEIDDLVLSPLAASQAILNERQKELGVALVDLGGGTTGLVVFEEGDLLHSAILPIGSEHITNDIAIGLRSSIDVAEKFKLKYGFAYPDEVDKKEEIDLSKIGLEEESVVRRKRIAEIIEARVKEIFSMVNDELKKIDKAGKLPAGVVFCGGGAKLPGIVDVAKTQLKLPAEVGFPQGFSGMVDKVDDPSYAVAGGLIIWGAKERLKEEEPSIFLPVTNIIDRIKRLFKSFLP